MTEMDPLGFGLENFDAIGRWRTEEDGNPVDASASCRPARIRGAGGVKKVLLMRRKDEFLPHSTRKMLGYALGRELEQVRSLRGRRRRQGALGSERLPMRRSLIERIVLSYPFQHRYCEAVARGGRPKLVDLATDVLPQGAGAARSALPWLDRMMRRGRAGGRQAAGRMALPVLPERRLADGLGLPDEGRGRLRAAVLPQPLAADRDGRCSCSPGSTRPTQPQATAITPRPPTSSPAWVVAKTTGKDISVGGISVDQLAAAEDRPPDAAAVAGTRHRPGHLRHRRNVGYTRLYGSYISWRIADAAGRQGDQPAARLSSGCSARRTRTANRWRPAERRRPQPARPGARRRQAACAAQLGRDDQLKLDEYLDSCGGRTPDRVLRPSPIRANGSRRRPGELPPPPGDPERPSRARAADARPDGAGFLDRLDADQHRSCSPTTSRVATSRSSTASAAAITSRRTTRTSRRKSSSIKRINRWHVEPVRLRARTAEGDSSEGDGTLLDNAHVLFGCGLSDGNRHDPNNLPILLGGKGGGTLARAGTSPARRTRRCATCTCRCWNAWAFRCNRSATARGH